MKKINLRGITESMSEREMKLVKGGVKVEVPAEPPLAEVSDIIVGGGGSDCNSLPSCGATPSQQYCAGKDCGAVCTANGKQGICKAFPGIPTCKICMLP